MTTRMNHLDDRPDSDAPSLTKHIVRAALSTLVLIIVSAFGVGMIAAHLDHGGGAMSVAFLASLTALGLIGIGAIVLMVRDLRAMLAPSANMPRRERASLKFLLIALIGGAIAGAFAGVIAATTNWFAGGGGTLPPAIAIGAALLTVTVGPWVTLRWWQAIDEHEQSAYADGANIAGHFALLAGFAWWMLSRAALVPAPDMMVLIIAMSFVWTGVWLYRKYGQ